MSTARIAIASISGLFAVVALATPGVVSDEGWRLKTYADPVSINTACAGVTAGVVAGKTYTQADCEALTAKALLDHALAIRPCIPGDLAQKTHAAFLSFAYNVGSSKFCASTLSRKARNGDLAGACAELSKWIYAGGKPLPGLVARRKRERAECEAGVAGA